MSFINRDAYVELADEDLAWLLSHPRSLERDHIEAIIRYSVRAFYPDTPPVMETIPVCEGAAPPPPSPIIRWKTDEAFCRFVSRFQETGAAVIDEDFSEAYEYVWRKLDWEQKAARVKALEEHMVEYAGNPRFVPKPLAFFDKEWKRPVRPPVTKPQEENRWKRTPVA